VFRSKIYWEWTGWNMFTAVALPFIECGYNAVDKRCLAACDNHMSFDDFLTGKARRLSWKQDSHSREVRFIRKPDLYWSTEAVCGAARQALSHGERTKPLIANIFTHSSSNTSNTTSHWPIRKILWRCGA